MPTFEENGSGQKPKVLVLGGCGFIGRHLVEFLLDKSEKIFVLDKTPPQIAWMNEAHSEVFSSPKVVYQSANLITTVGCEKAFEHVDPDIDYVFNLASETRKGQSEGVYREGIYKLTLNVVQQVASKFRHSLKLFIEFSTGTLYANDKTPHKENEKVDLWNFEAKYKYQAEQEVGKNLSNYIIIRPAIVYGPGDRNGITPRLVVGGIYKHCKEMMKLPWTADIRTHTVHVHDLVRAVYFLAQNGKHGQIYNVVDEGETTQGDVSSIVSEIFDINHDYWGSTFTTLAKLDLNDVTDEINEKHMEPWAKICLAGEVPNTPLTPYIHNDALVKKYVSLSGKKLTEAGFTDFKYPRLTKEALEEVLQDFVATGMFPRSLLEK